MLLYHFPLNTADNISNFTNVGLLQDYSLKGKQESPANEGIISQKCLETKTNTFSVLMNNPEKFTLAFRFRLKSLTNGAWTTLICFYQNTTNRRSIYWNANTTKLYFGGTPVNPDLNWHNVVVEYEYQANSCRFFLDNVLVDTNYNQTFTSISLFDRFYDNNYTLQAYFQDIRIYDYALSQAEINEYSRALVVHYPLQGNELNQSVLKDISGLGNDYILQGTNSYQLDSARGLKSLHTTDTAIYTQTPISSGYTTSFWCKYNGEWKHLCNNGSKYVNGVVNSSLFDTIYATLTASGYDIVDYRVYATALSAEDIKNLYNSPVHLDNQHTLQCSEVVENAKYPNNYWRTPTSAEMNYIRYNRPNANDLCTLCRIEITSGKYVKGCLLLPDDWVTPTGLSINPTTADYTTNSYSITDFETLENAGAVFFPNAGYRSTGDTHFNSDYGSISCSTFRKLVRWGSYGNILIIDQNNLYYAFSVRLCRSSQDSHSFNTSATTKIKFAKSNLQYHCTQHKWRFAEHSYDFIGAANTNVSDSYNGWIDLFGYGTSGVNYSPTLHTTNNADYASGDISNTDNDWGINEIQSYDYNVQNFALNKNGIVQHNELNEYDLLPQEYQLVEYLESTGEQWIDTEYYPLKSDIIKIIYGYVASIGNQSFGCAQTTPVFNRCHTITIINSSLVALLCKDTGNSIYISAYGDSRFLTFTWKQDSVNINDEITAPNECTYPNLSFFLFARNTNGSASNHTTCKGKEFSVDGKINMFPCYRKSDGKPGMYDTIRHKFFTNKGTGADFLVGNDVSKINGIYKDKILTNELIEN